MNHDQLNMVPAHPTIQSAYAALSGAQDSLPAMQVMGFAVLFNEVCKALNLDPSEMLDKARRVARHSEDHFSLEIGALRQYIHTELK